MFHRIAATGLLFCLFLGAPILADAIPLEEVLSADADMVLMIPNVPAFLEAWPQSALGKAWNDPELEKFFAPMREELMLDRLEEMAQDGTGRSVAELLANFTGELALVVHDVSNLDSDDFDGPGGLVARIGGDREAIEQLFELEMESAREKADEGVELDWVEEEFLGETLHLKRETREGTETLTEGWAIAGGYAVSASPVDYLKDLISALHDGPEEAYAAQSTYQRVRERSGDPDLLLTFDMSKLFAMVEEEITQDMGDGASEADNPMGIEPAAVLRAMAFDNIEGFFLATRLDSDATTLDAGFVYREDRGIVKLLAFEPGPVRFPEFIPADVIEAAVYNFSFPRMWSGLREMLEVMSPSLSGFFDMQLEQLKAQSGVDLEQGLIGSLGTYVFTADFKAAAQTPGEEASLDAMEQVIGIEITDRQSLEMSLGALSAMIGAMGQGFEPQEYLDFTIHVARSAAEPDAPPAFAYSLTDKYLLFGQGGVSALQSVLGRMAEPNGGVWKRPEVVEAMTALPAGASGISYSNTLGVMEMFFKGLAKVSAEGEESDDSLPFDAGAAPDLALLKKYFGIGVGGTYKDGRGIYGTVRLLNPR